MLNDNCYYIAFAQPLFLLANLLILCYNIFVTRNTQIVGIDDKTIIVRFGNSASCENCNCVFKGFGDVKFDTSVLVDRTEPIAVGDTAVIDVPDTSISIAPFILFVLPLVALGIGLLLGSIWGIVAQGILMLAFLAVSIRILYLLDKSVKNKVKYSMSLKSIMPASLSENTTCEM